MAQRTPEARHMIISYFYIKLNENDYLEAGAQLITGLFHVTNHPKYR